MALRDGSTVISKLVKEGKLLVVGGVYDLDTGKVTPVELGA
jgi:carbonic anhydrase